MTEIKIQLGRLRENALKVADQATKILSSLERPSPVAPASRKKLGAKRKTKYMSLVTAKKEIE